MNFISHDNLEAFTRMANKQYRDWPIRLGDISIADSKVTFIQNNYLNAPFWVPGAPSDPKQPFFLLLTDLSSTSRIYEENGDPIDNEYYVLDLITQECNTYEIQGTSESRYFGGFKAIKVATQAICYDACMGWDVGTGDGTYINSCATTLIFTQPFFEEEVTNGPGMDNVLLTSGSIYLCKPVETSYGNYTFTAIPLYVPSSGGGTSGTVSSITSDAINNYFK